MTHEIYNNQGQVIRKSQNLRGIRRHASKVIASKVMISKHNDHSGHLCITFNNGDNYTTHFASYEVLCLSLRNWRSLYGTPLEVAGNPCMTVGYNNPYLKQYSNWCSWTRH